MINQDSIIKRQLDEWFKHISFYEISTNPIGSFKFNDNANHIYQYSLSEKRLVYCYNAYYDLVKPSDFNETKFNILFKEYLRNKFKLEIETIW